MAVKQDMQLRKPVLLMLEGKFLSHEMEVKNDKEEDRLN